MFSSYPFQIPLLEELFDFMVGFFRFHHSRSIAEKAYHGLNLAPPKSNYQATKPFPDIKWGRRFALSRITVRFWSNLGRLYDQDVECNSRCVLSPVLTSQELRAHIVSMRSRKQHYIIDTMSSLGSIRSRSGMLAGGQVVLPEFRTFKRRWQELCGVLLLHLRLYVISMAARKASHLWFCSSCEVSGLHIACIHGIYF